MINSFEFDRFLNEYLASHTTLTQDDYYNIGLKYREVSEKKDWDKLAKRVGYSSGENLRTLVKNRLAKMGKIKKKKDVVDEILENPDDKKKITEINIKMEQLMKEQTKNRDLLNAYRQKVRDGARVEIIIDAIKSCQKSLEQLPKITPKEVTKEETTEAVLLISDWHIGSCFKNFFNEYNETIAINRISKLLNDVIWYCNKFKVKRLNVLNLGDLIKGLIHTNARIEQEFDVAKQTMEAGEILAEFLNRVQQAAPEVVYRSVTDNHARFNPDKDVHIEQENFYRIIDWYLKSRLEHTSIIFAEDNIDRGLGKFDLMNGKKVMFAHGHEDDYNKIMQNWIGATKEFIDYCCIGHYHCEKSKNFQDVKVFVNGSIMGTDEYALSKRLFSSPSQSLLIFDDENLINISVDLKGECK